MSGESENTSDHWSLVGAGAAAIAAASCCVGPVVLVSLGVTGAWIGQLSALEPYQPYLMSMAFGFLGFAFYRVYWSAGGAEACEAGEACQSSGPNRTAQIVLWTATVCVVLLGVSPYLVSIFSSVGAEATPENEAVESQSTDRKGTASGEAMKQVTLEVDGMTCGGCAQAVERALRGVDGVSKASVTHKPPLAEVHFNGKMIDVQGLTDATERLGYTSRPKQ